MDNYPAPAATLVAHMTASAAANPAQAAAFQGAPGAYSHLATREALPDHLPLPCFSFEDALEAVTTAKADLAVIPVENSQAGRVADIHFLLPAAGLYIVGEHFLRVRHCLLAHKGVRREELKEALSHTQALGQTRERFRSWGIRQVQYPDTAGAAAYVASQADRSIGAVASKLAGDIYGLDVLAEGIEDVDHNTTRFLVLSRSPSDPDPADGAMMTTFVFQVRSVPAALFKALGGFATNGVNMTKLESYQRDGSFTSTEFYADIEGSPREPHVARAFEELAYFSQWVRVLGTYPRARDRLTEFA
jgi:prephenate dehydratase